MSSASVSDKNDIWAIYGLRTYHIKETNTTNKYMVYFILSILFMPTIETVIADSGDYIVIELIPLIYVDPGANFSFDITLNNIGVRQVTSTIKFDEMPDCINKLDNYYEPKTISRGRSATFNVRFKVDDDAKEGEYVLKVSDSTGGIGDPDTWTDITILISKDETKITPTSIQTPTSTPVPMSTTSPTAFALAKTAIEDAKTKIYEANSRGAYTTQAELLLEEAERAFDYEDYSKAMELAKLVKRKAEVSMMAHNVLIGTIIAVFIYIVVSVLMILKKR